MRTFNLEEAAAYLKIHQSTLSEIASSGAIEGAARIGRAWVFLEDGLVGYIKKVAAEQNKQRKIASGVMPATMRGRRHAAQQPLPDLSALEKAAGMAAQ